MMEQSIFFFFSVYLTCLLFSSTLIFNTQLCSAEKASTPPPNKESIGELEDEIGFYQSILLSSKEPLYSKQSKYQNVAIYQSEYYGKVLVLDNVVQLTERDANSYNEMMAHIAMMAHPQPKRVLVVGGGDGYVLSEVLKHSTVEHVDHVDLDGDVVDACKVHFSWGAAWKDPRVTLHISDGFQFVTDAEDSSYDVVVQDSSDPWTQDEDGTLIPLPSGVLYSPQHFRNVHRVLTSDGVFNFQAETFNIPSDLNGIVQWRKSAIHAGFTNARYGSLMISSYPTGQIGFLLCTKKLSNNLPPMDLIQKRFDEIKTNGLITSYYHPKLQSSSFDLPLWVEHAIYGEGSEPDEFVNEL